MFWYCIIIAETSAAFSQNHFRFRIRADDGLRTSAPIFINASKLNGKNYRNKSSEHFDFDILVCTVICVHTHAGNNVTTSPQPNTENSWPSCHAIVLEFVAHSVDENCRMRKMHEILFDRRAFALITTLVWRTQSIANARAVHSVRSEKKHQQQFQLAWPFFAQQNGTLQILNPPFPPALRHSASRWNL